MKASGNINMQKIPVLIIGAGPVGLSLALALARQNVQSMVIEQLPRRSEYPRARGVSMRTMELLAQWGNINDLLKYEFPKEAIRFIWSESLRGKEVTRVELKQMNKYTYGPQLASFVTQDFVEQYLHDNLKKYSQSEVKFSRELLAFKQNKFGVIARILDKNTGQEEEILADYLIAADGAHSRIRKKLGIEMVGPDDLGKFCSVYCEMDLSKWTAERQSIGYFFTNPKLFNRSLMTAYGKIAGYLVCVTARKIVRKIFLMSTV